MHFSKISSSAAFILLLLSSSVFAAPAAAADPLPQPYREEAAPGQDEYPSEPAALSKRREEAAPGQPEYPEEAPASLGKRGFGCPFNAYACSDHCRSLGGGRSGGYCGGPVWLGHPTCICIFN